ncbi:TetR/AcrR family transcriptional regulator [Sphingobium sp.]|uniref:TetR/AcrR family transcriptional regulator n=1 Tax=Sphingobium sp. TaxID=1912891 RepID=UPI0028BE1CBD|nr:TetR/AcrR family transcriptional regulator [Sphingobium sp.]
MNASTAKKPSAKTSSRLGAGRLKPDVVAFKRSRILEAASSLFYMQGYEATTLDMIAERLHVTKPFLYSYFRNKSDILASICELGIRESLVALDASADVPGNSVDRLRTTLAKVAEIIVDRHAYIIVYQREMMNLDRVDAQRTLRQRAEFDLRLARLVAACQEEGFVTIEDATAMSPWMGGLLSWIPSYYRPGGKRPREEIVESAVHACMRMIGLG